MNEQRKRQAPTKLKQINAAAAEIGLELPEKTKAILLESLRGITAMQRFVEDPEQSRAEVDAQLWADLTQTDPLAAELEAISRGAAQGRARM